MIADDTEGPDPVKLVKNTPYAAMFPETGTDASGAGGRGVESK